MLRVLSLLTSRPTTAVSLVRLTTTSAGSVVQGVRFLSSTSSSLSPLSFSSSAASSSSPFPSSSPFSSAAAPSVAEELSTLPAGTVPLDEAVANGLIQKGTANKLRAKGYEGLFTIQTECIGPIKEMKDLVARARTGTGKTMAFLIPLVERLLESQSTMMRGRQPRVVIITPTRELAMQIGTEVASLSSTLQSATLYGGTSYDTQVRKLQSGVDIVVATPGRLKDLVARRAVRYDQVQTLVLDEADTMLDQGFADDMDAIIQEIKTAHQSVPDAKLQILLFSATIPEWTQRVSRDLMSDPITINQVSSHLEYVLPEALSLQGLILPPRANKLMALFNLVREAVDEPTIIFANQKLVVDSIADYLPLRSFSRALHGDHSQRRREEVVSDFKAGAFNVLVATDVASRGLDIPNVTRVIHFDFPDSLETFVHRSGRAGRAGRTGAAIAMLSAAEASRFRAFANQLERKPEIQYANANMDLESFQVLLDKDPAPLSSSSSLIASQIITSEESEKIVSKMVAMLMGSTQEPMPSFDPKARGGRKAFGGPRESSGRGQGGYRPSSSSYGDRSSSYGDRSSSYGDRSSSYGDRSSSYGDRSSSYGDRSSSYGDRSSSYGDRSSSYGDRSSSYGGSSSFGDKPYSRSPSRSSSYGDKASSYGDKYSSYGSSSSSSSYGGSARGGSYKGGFSKPYNKGPSSFNPE